MPTVKSTTQPRAVLVVDDDEGARLVIARMLQEQMVTVITAASGAEAISVLAADSGTIGTVLTDVTMPDMTGIELAYQVRDRFRHVGIVIVSGDISDIERSVVARAGVPFLKKPVRIDTLLGAIRDASPPPPPPGHEHPHEASSV